MSTEPQTKKKPLISRWGWIGIILAGAVIFTAVFLTKCRKDPAAPVIIPVKDQAKVVEKYTGISQAKFDSLNSAFKKQESTTADLKKSLKDAQAYARVLENDLQRDQPATATSSPSEYTLDDLIDNSRERDSLANKTIAELDSQLVNRNALIAAKDTLNFRLRQSLQVSFDQQTALQDYNKQLKKTIKRKNFGLFLWKTAAVAATTLLIKQQFK